MSDGPQQKYNGQGGLPIKRYMTKLYLTEPAPRLCVFARHFITGWENTKEFQVAADQSWLRLNAENGTALYRRTEGIADVGTNLYELKEASWNQPPPMAAPEQLALDW